MKKIVIAGVIVVVLAAAAFMIFGRKGDEIRFRTEKVTRGDITMTVTATGTMNAVTTVLVGTQVSGTIKDIYVDYNSPVKKGQLIAQIDPATFQAQVSQARANLLSAKANLDKAEATLVDARRTMERYKKLSSEGLVAKSDFDTADTNYETAKASVGAAGSQVAQTQAALEFAETNLRYTKILSPVDGVVISRSVDVGQTVAASFQTPTLFTIAQDLTKMQIDTSVDESDIGKVKVGQDVEFAVDAYPETTFKGKVWQVRNAPITVENVVTYDVVVQVANPDLKLKPGMTENVSIIVAKKMDVLRIPNAALRFRMPEKVRQSSKRKPERNLEKRGVGLWILQNNGQPRHIPVSLGISDGTYTELVSGDISEGEEIIVESLSDGKETRDSRPRMRMF